MRAATYIDQPLEEAEAVHTIAVWTIKGGVGKTAAAVNLAHAAAMRGTRTLLWDLDPQGATSFYLRIPPHLPKGVRSVIDPSIDLLALIRPSEFDNLFLLPADFSYRHLDLELDAGKKPRKRLLRMLDPLADDFDLVLIDCPPSVSLVSEAVLRASEAVLVPVIPTTLSMRTLDQVRDFAHSTGKHEPLLLPFLSMVDRRKRMHLDTCDLCLADDGFLRTTIPSASVVERMGLSRAPVAATLPSQPAAKAFASLWAEIAQRLHIGPGMDPSLER
jgi:cellulose biosynthesis protein BcsQ